ncbi:hypothetical protein [uncultured Lacinutrix sp.]|uniref:hypothetical protein n=1 Tax=uncultured Lacinutrix sp. TaxID=574032 RepID=UPI00262C17C0|nr:hypothetical protein [uncultured Lacinutrix sp.]
MKTTIKKSMLIVTTLIATLSYATSNTTSNKDGVLNNFTISIKDAVKGQQLSIININGIIMYKEEIKKNGMYSKTFDLTSLPNGNYFFELDKGIEITTTPFTVTYNKVLFNKNEETKLYKPFVRVENNFLYVSQLSLNKNPLKIELYYNAPENDNFELLLSETIDNTLDIGRVYKLSKKEIGKYKIILKTEGKTFVEKITH